MELAGVAPLGIEGLRSKKIKCTCSITHTIAHAHMHDQRVELLATRLTRMQACLHEHERT